MFSMKWKALFFLPLVFSIACSKSGQSLYAGLAPNEDGVIAGDVGTAPDGTDENEIAAVDQPALVLPDVLLSKESELIKKWHSGQTSKVSFLVVDAEDGNIMRTYLSEKPRRLASVTKIATSLTALENVNDISVAKISAMLKSSNNSEASRYVRLVAKSIGNLIIPGSPNPDPHSCPSSSTLQAEYPAAAIVLLWLKSQILDVDWSGGVLKDGAGCDYGNFMNTLQIVNILKLADSKGKAFAGLSYEELLSVSGVDGTWANHNIDAKGRVLAKTGTLSLNSNLAGYFYAKRDGKLHKYYFTIFVEKSSSENAADTRSLMENLLRFWINYYNVQKGEAIAAL
jgi:D-alanyl-D-alanine carboxypeptidase